MKHYDHVLAWTLEHPWAVTPTHRRVIAQILARRLAGQDVDPQIVQVAAANRSALPQPKRGGGLAVIPLCGTLAPRINLLSDFSGGATFEGLEQQLAAAVADPQVQTIILDVNSPGGSVAGATECARAVLKARSQKPIVAVANHLMASAAYWVAACATEIVASPSAEVGSVGVYALYEDLSAALEEMGIKRTVISAGKFKAEGADDGPMTDEMRAHLQSRVDLHYHRFIADVAAGRGMKADVVTRTFGEGRTVDAGAALAAGMVDRLGTLTDTIERLRPKGTTAAPPTFAFAALDPLSPATDQEPLPATSQERTTDAHWRNTFHGDLLNIDLHMLSEGTP
jgi:signal peptide peptidase SppA